MNLSDLSELLQDDLCCILDGVEEKKQVAACQAVIDRLDEYRTKSEE